MGIVIDPQRDIDQYLKAARVEEFAIKHVSLTFTLILWRVSWTYKKPQER